MAKNSGLGKGLASLIPDVSSEVEQEEPISLADMLAKDEAVVENEENEAVEEVEVVEEAQEEQVEDTTDDIEEEIGTAEDEAVEEVEVDKKDDQILVEEETSEASEKSTKIKEEPIKNIEDNQETTKNIEPTNKENDVDVLLSKKDEENVCQVIEIVESNPRITLWSARSAAVLRYLRKTEPEFSISNEASKLIEEALAEKYPEIWTLFDHL